MIDYDAMQREAIEWANYNFSNRSDDVVSLALIEEAGELAHAQLKLSHGIRGTETELLLKAADAVGDITIVLTDVCDRRQLRLSLMVAAAKRHIAMAGDHSRNRFTIVRSIAYYTADLATKLVEQAHGVDNLTVIVICNLISFCNSINIDYDCAVENSWEEVKMRDWRKYTKNGNSHESDNVTRHQASTS